MFLSDNMILGTSHCQNIVIGIKKKCVPVWHNLFQTVSFGTILRQRNFDIYRNAVDTLATRVFLTVRFFCIIIYV